MSGVRIKAVATRLDLHLKAADDAGPGHWVANATAEAPAKGPAVLTHAASGRRSCMCAAKLPMDTCCLRVARALLSCPSAVLHASLIQTVSIVPVRA
jgi:hypothetical protein